MYYTIGAFVNEFHIINLFWEISTNFKYKPVFYQTNDNLLINIAKPEMSRAVGILSRNLITKNAFAFGALCNAIIQTNC